MSYTGSNRNKLNLLDIMGLYEMRVNYAIQFVSLSLKAPMRKQSQRSSTTETIPIPRTSPRRPPTADR